MSEIITQWIMHIAEGDADAAQKIWNDYFGKLVRLARRKLEGLPNRDSDEEDVALSAMNSFYQGLVQNKFDHIHSRDDLWKLLVTITVRKATARRRSHFAQKRGGGQVRGESIFGNQEDGDDGLARILGTEPTPELAVSVAENCRLMLDQLPDEAIRQVALWTLEGYRIDEIADKLGCVRRTVERKLERIREIWGEVPEQA
ncbi:MAG: helix-turn-helix domain-containing protein [Planctomycetaceae bacterium]|jgi:DNA-directed RNA polymerase specialized sigma24 family protein|nr:helix-turn-helix domain-containing protein [Planctomycetaceae bacterium]